MNKLTVGRSIQILIFLMLSGLLLGSCSQRSMRPTPEEKQLLLDGIESMGPEFSQPRLVTGELIVRIDSIQVQDQNSGPVGEAWVRPALHIWAADVMDYRTQHVRAEPAPRVTPVPTKNFEDEEYGNRIHYWDILADSAILAPVTLQRSFTYITYDYRPIPDPEVERQNWHLIPDSIISQYTRSEVFLEQDDALIDTVFSLLKDVPDPVAQARVIYDWVQAIMTYQYPPAERGVRSAFETLSGDCGQYSALFITMARIAGIPARQQSGFNFYPGNTGSHVWSEIYLPIKGWVPVDATREDGFLHLDHGRLIMSTGLNIPLQAAPEWANYGNSELDQGSTDFMQMYTLAMRGVSARFATERKILRSVGL